MSSSIPTRVRNRKGAEEAVVLSAYYNDDKTLVIKLWVPRPGKTLYRYVDDRVVFQVVRDDREVIATYIVVGEQHEEVVSGVGSSQILRLIERMIQYHTENGNVNEAEKLARLINTVSEVEVVRE